MAYAISWIGTQTGKVCIGPTLYKYVERKDRDTRKKVLMNKREAEEVCDKANFDDTWNGLEHTAIEVNEKENNEREIPDEKILIK